MKKIINTTLAPAPIGPYSQAVLVNDTLYISGQVAYEPATGKLITVNIIQETNQLMNNLLNILKAAEMDFSNVVKVSIFLIDMNNFTLVNEVYASYFKDILPSLTTGFPARETIQVSRLPKDVNVEISMIAVK
jgi:2-iminobutanoate/2-iminopropanoate deaminase